MAVGKDQLPLENLIINLIKFCYWLHYMILITQTYWFSGKSKYTNHAKKNSWQKFKKKIVTLQKRKQTNCTTEIEVLFMWRFRDM